MATNPTLGCRPRSRFDKHSRVRHLANARGCAMKKSSKRNIRKKKPSNRKRMKIVDVKLLTPDTFLFAPEFAPLTPFTEKALEDRRSRKLPPFPTSYIGR